MILCQPVHPQALRLLLLHSIYRGPERRIRRRTPIGHQIRVRAGLFRSAATLLELSPSGARIQMTKMPKLGTKLRVQLGKELTLGRPLKLQAEVVRRIGRAAEGKGATVQVGLSLINASAHSQAIEEILARFADGPATWKVERPRPMESSSPDCGSNIDRFRDEAPTRSADSENEDGEEFDPSIKSAATDDEEEECDDASSTPSDRRTNMRVPYHRRIVALDEEAARVLVGCDLSPGGMRVVSNASVAVNDRFRVALHCGTEMEPLVVMARAHRDDGDDGLVLVFEGLTANQSSHLEKIVANSGSIRSATTADASCAETEQSLIVGELLETMTEDGSASDSDFECDPEFDADSDFECDQDEDGHDLDLDLDPHLSSVLADDPDER